MNMYRWRGIYKCNFLVYSCFLILCVFCVPKWSLQNITQKGGRIPTGRYEAGQDLNLELSLTEWLIQIIDLSADLFSPLNTLYSNCVFIVQCAVSLPNSSNYNAITSVKYITLARRKTSISSRIFKTGDVSPSFLYNKRQFDKCYFLMYQIAP